MNVCTLEILKACFVRVYYNDDLSEFEEHLKNNSKLSI